MSNLFISHSSRDNAAAKGFQARLEEQGHRAVVALGSDTYIASQWCFAPAPPITSEMRRDQESSGLESGRLSMEPR